MIPNGLEKCMAFMINKNLVFIDSMQFVNSSPDKLVRNLADDDFKYFTHEIGSKNLELLKQKDAYPYEYMDSFKRFNEEKLPDKKYFYRSLKDGTTDDSDEKVDGHISDKEYLTCDKISNELYMKNMGYYHDYYLEKDVLLLVNVFKKFIDRCLKLYKLDSWHYFSSSGLSWDVMLKITGITLEKISDISIYIFIEKGLKRGISYIDTVKQITNT